MSDHNSFKIQVSTTQNVRDPKVHEACMAQKVRNGKKSFKNVWSHTAQLQIASLVVPPESLMFKH